MVVLLGFDEELGLLESFDVELPVELPVLELPVLELPVPIDCEPPIDPLIPLPWPLPVTVMLSSTLRLPAYDCAIRLAVCFSLPVSTVPESETLSSDTFTSTPESPDCC